MADGPAAAIKNPAPDVTVVPKAPSEPAMLPPVRAAASDAAGAEPVNKGSVVQNGADAQGEGTEDRAATQEHDAPDEDPGESTEAAAANVSLTQLAPLRSGQSYLGTAESSSGIQSGPAVIEAKKAWNVMVRKWGKDQGLTEFTDEELKNDKYDEAFEDKVRKFQEVDAAARGGKPWFSEFDGKLGPRTIAQILDRAGIAELKDEKLKDLVALHYYLTGEDVPSVDSDVWSGTGLNDTDDKKAKLQELIDLIRNEQAKKKKEVSGLFAPFYQKMSENLEVVLDANALDPSFVKSPSGVRETARAETQEALKGTDLTAEQKQEFATFADAVVAAESGGNQFARSKADALGAMQVIPKTVSEIITTDRGAFDRLKTLGAIDSDVTFENQSERKIKINMADPRVASALGTRYLLTQYMHYGHNTELASAAYNAGPHRVNTDGSGKWTGFAETREYVRRVSDYMSSVWNPSRNVPVVPKHIGDGIIFEPLDDLGDITGKVGNRYHPIRHRNIFHKGTDFAVPKGRPVFPSNDGVVTFSGWKDGYGNIIEITGTLPDGRKVVSRYAHLDVRNVEKNAVIRAGDRKQIGLSGDTGGVTGPHLHYELEIDGELESTGAQLSYFRTNGVSRG